MTDRDQTEAAFSVAWGAATHPGNLRAENQDSLLARPPIFLVADGMGGHERGREASSLVVRAFDEASVRPTVTPHDLGAATTAATSLVHGLGTSGPGAPGSTVSGVGLALHQNRPCWLVFNIGDSRTYLLRAGEIEQVTVDHSRVQELLDAGVAAADASHQVGRNVITRAIGGGSQRVPMADQWLVPAEEGDRMLVCSDGLTGELTDQLIAATLMSCGEPADAAEQLVSSAVAAGGRDNVTVVVVDALTVAGCGRPGDDAFEDTLSNAPLFSVAEPGDTVPDADDDSFAQGTYAHQEATS